MSTACLVVTFHLPDQRYHGRRDGGVPEWPPSPMRAFQALCAAAFARWRGAEMPAAVEAALRWMESLSAPQIIAPAAQRGAAIPLYVPNNDGNVAVQSQRKEGNRDYGTLVSKLRTLKVVQPHLLSDAPVRFVWAVDASPEVGAHAAQLQTLAHHVVSLGWGTDLAIADAGLLPPPAVESLPGERWRPSAQGGTILRVPMAGTLDDLIYRHAQFLNRMDEEVLRPPPPLSAYRRVGYTTARHEGANVAIFSLRRPDREQRAVFSLERDGLRLAGMVRDCIRRQAIRNGVSEEQIATIILGHGEAAGEQHAPVPHLSILPLPSIEYRGDGRRPAVGQVRRIAIVADDPALAEWIDWLKAVLPGARLIDERTQAERAVLELAEVDGVVERYTQRATTWATVTPVILPGMDDKGGVRKRLAKCTDAEEQRRLLGQLDARIDQLLRKAMRHAGIPTPLVESARLMWQREPLWHGTPTEFGVPSHTQHAPRFHVRLRWEDEDGTPVEIPGPFCFGRGRFYGVGLFAAEE